MELLFAIGVCILFIVLLYSLTKRIRCIERANMCEAWAKAFETCPECYVKGAEYISERWLDEMEKMGIDFGRKRHKYHTK